MQYLVLLTSGHAWTEADYNALWIPRADAEHYDHAHWLSEVPQYDAFWILRVDAEHSYYAHWLAEVPQYESFWIQRADAEHS